MAERIQRKRTKGWRMPEGAVYVGRPTKWGNPYTPANYRFVEHPYPVEDGKATGPWTRVERPATSAECVQLYRTEVACNRDCPPEEHPWADALDVHELRGRDLACWCPLDQPCHADVLLDLANPKEVRRG